MSSRDPASPDTDRSADTGTYGTRILDEAGPTVSVREAAIVLGCSSDLIYAMHARGELIELGIRALRLGSLIRISTASLRRVVDAEQGPPGNGGPRVRDKDSGPASTRPQHIAPGGAEPDLRIPAPRPSTDPSPGRVNRVKDG